MRKLLCTFYIVSICWFCNVLQAQNTLTYQYPEQMFMQGKAAFEAGQFNLSNDLLTAYRNTKHTQPAYDDQSEFMLMVSDLFLNKQDAEKNLEIYARDGRNRYFSNQANFYLADYYRVQENYPSSQKYFSRVKEEQLPKEVREDYNFKYGLVLLEKDKLKEAYSRFGKVQLNKYKDDANYYLGYIHYLNGEYDEAQKYFDLVKSNQYKTSIAYFALQKKFVEGDMDGAKKGANAMYKTSKQGYKAEIARILGYIAFQNHDVDKAKDYYEVYQENIEKLSREDIYLLGESYYALETYKQAADAFTKVATLEDELSQNAYNKLAACYIQLDDKPMARMAFESASRYTFNKEIQEEALFNYCKLTYQLSYSPFNEIIEAFEKFLKLFPNSAYTPEMYDLLSEVFLTTNNYERAYESLKKLEISNPKLERALQRVAYYRAIELFNDLELESSITYFTRSLENSNNDKKLKAQAFYWRGEAYFRLADNEAALADFNAFVQSPYASRLDEFKMAHYSLGYTYFKLNQPNPAIVWFGKYATLQKSQPDIRLSDSYNRLGDCYYLKRNFDKAIKYYDYAIDMGLNGSDYSHYQKAFCLGLQKDYTGKIATLDELTRLFQKSNLLDDAYFEKGKTYTFMSKSANALSSYKTLIDKYKESELRSKAMVNSALIHYNSNNEAQAVAMYKRVIHEYPRTDETQLALNALKTIAIDNNSVDEYLLYTKKLGNRVAVVNNDADSLTYISAEKLYMKGNVVNSKNYFGSYIEKYPNGRYLLSAHYYKADCHFKLNESAEAIKDLEAIVEQPTNRYTEESLARLAEIYFDKEKYDAALPYYTRLMKNAKSTTHVVDANMGALRCQYLLQHCDAVMQQAHDVLAAQILSDELKREAYYYQAKCALSANDIETAKTSFEKISGFTRTEFGAEAKYQVAKIYYENGEKEKAIEEIKDFIQKNTPHQYWLAKSFVVLAQISIDKGDDFQAKQYLSSVKENYKKNDDVQAQVARLIFEIDEREAKRYQQRRDSLLKLLNDTGADVN